MDVILNILPVFLVIFLGAGIKWLGFFSDTFVKEANRLVFFIGIPALLFVKLSQAPFHKTFDLNLAVISCFSIFAIWVLSLLAVRFRLLRTENSSQSASFVQASMHGNIGYIGFAVIFFVFGDNGINIAGFLATFIILTQNILSVLSFNIFSGGTGKKSGSLLSALKNIIVNPIIISSITGIIFSFYDLKLPCFLTRSLEIVSSMSLPIALLIIGSSLSLSLLSQSFFRLFSSSLLKLLFLPGIGVILLIKSGAPIFSIEIATILLGVPTATVSVIMSGEMNGDPGFASSAVTLSTLLSILTLCFWVSLISFFF